MTETPKAKLKRIALIVPVFLAFVSGCSETPDRVEIVETRDFSEFDKEPIFDASVELRLDNGLIYAPKPEGWTRRPSTDQRLINYTFGPNEEGEVYVSSLPFSTNPEFIPQNIARWCAQMGRDPLTNLEILELPEIMVLKKPGVKVTLDGNFTPMGASKTFDDYRMLGAIGFNDNQLYFVKMTGPKDLVIEQEANFDEFSSTFVLR